VRPSYQFLGSPPRSKRWLALPLGPLAQVGARSRARGRRNRRTPDAGRTPPGRPPPLPPPVEGPAGWTLDGDTTTARSGPLSCEIALCVLRRGPSHETRTRRWPRTGGRDDGADRTLPLLREDSRTPPRCGGIGETADVQLERHRNSPERSSAIVPAREPEESVLVGGEGGPIRPDSKIDTRTAGGRNLEDAELSRSSPATSTAATGRPPGTLAGRIASPRPVKNQATEAARARGDALRPGRQLERRDQQTEDQRQYEEPADGIRRRAFSTSVFALTGLVSTRKCPRAPSADAAVQGRSGPHGHRERQRGRAAGEHVAIRAGSAAARHARARESTTVSTERGRPRTRCRRGRRDPTLQAGRDPRVRVAWWNHEDNELLDSSVPRHFEDAAGATGETASGGCHTGA